MTSLRFGFSVDLEIKKLETPANLANPAISNPTISKISRISKPAVSNNEKFPQTHSLTPSKSLPYMDPSENLVIPFECDQNTIGSAAG